MRNKITVLVLLASVLGPVSTIGGLLRNPKVYNAVITTDENLTPSRAYPVVQPVVHEAGLSYPFGAFGPFGLYNAFNAYPGFYQPTGSSGTSAQHQQAPAAAVAPATSSRLIAATTPQLHHQQQFQQQFQHQQLQHLQQPQHPQPNLHQAEFIQGRNSFYPLRAAEPEPQLQETPIETIPVHKPVPEASQPFREAPAPELVPEPNNSIAPKAPEGPRPNYEAGHPVDSKSPLHLNEFGLPPSLIPLNNHYAGQNQQQFQLQGYPYNFPALYDGFSNYNPSQYQSVLPPFGYFPQFAQPNPYFGAGVQSHPGNSVDPQQRTGREQELNEPEKDGPADEETPEGPIDPATEAAGEAGKAEADSKPAEPEAAPAPVPAPAESSNISESIKNNANKNKAVPDVPPPPIPSGAKATQRE